MYDTNYEGKTEAAINALKGDCDFVFLHIEASDEAGHEGDMDLKIRTIEYLDKRVLAPIVNALSSINEPVTIAVLPDHPTPCRIRTHTATPVPFLIYRKGMEADDVITYNEVSATNGSYGNLTGVEFINQLFEN